MNISSRQKILIVITIMLSIGLHMLFKKYHSHLLLDISDKNLYSLSVDSKNLVNMQQKSLYLELYITPKLLVIYPNLSGFVKRVEQLIIHYQHASTHIHSKIIHVQPADTALQQQLIQTGLLAIPVKKEKQPLFFGLVVRSSQNSISTLPFLEPDNEANLERLIAAAIVKVTDNNHELVQQIPMKTIPHITALNVANLSLLSIIKILAICCCPTCIFCYYCYYMRRMT
jgi:ABC-type uncharacterized transport system involved in gliding motility auxiliary subunit